MLQNYNFIEKKTTYIRFLLVGRTPDRPSDICTWRSYNRRVQTFPPTSYNMSLTQHPSAGALCRLFSNDLSIPPSSASNGSNKPLTTRKKDNFLNLVSL